MIKRKTSSNIKANEIIALFMYYEIPITQQLEILKMVKQKIEFCRNTGKEVKQQKLKLL
jgi:hypothetical protein